MKSYYMYLTHTPWLKIILKHLISDVQSNPVNTDTGRAKESVCIKRGVSIKQGELRENVRAFFPQGQSIYCPS